MAFPIVNGGEDQYQGHDTGTDRRLQPLRESLELRTAVCKAIEKAFSKKGVAEVSNLEAECSAVIEELTSNSFRPTDLETTRPRFTQTLENRTADPVRGTLEMKHTLRLVQVKEEQTEGQVSCSGNANLNASEYKADGTGQVKASRVSNTKAIAKTVTHSEFKPLEAVGQSKTERINQAVDKAEELEVKISARADKSIVVSLKRWKRVMWGAMIGILAGYHFATPVIMLVATVILKSTTSVVTVLLVSVLVGMVGGACLGAVAGYAYYCMHDNHCTVTVKVRDIFKHLPGRHVEEEGIVHGTIKVNVSEHVINEIFSYLPGGQPAAAPTGPLDVEQEQDLVQIEAKLGVHQTGLRKRN